MKCAVALHDVPDPPALERRDVVWHGTDHGAGTGSGSRGPFSGLSTGSFGTGTSRGTGSSTGSTMTTRCGSPTCISETGSSVRLLNGLPGGAAVARRVQRALRPDHVADARVARRPGDGAEASFDHEHRLPAISPVAGEEDAAAGREHPPRAGGSH